MTIYLRALTLHDLQQLARADMPEGLPGLVADAALPPPFVAARALGQLAAGKPQRWCSTFFIMRDADSMLVGGCGFKDAPREGRVEIGYAVAPGYRNQGIATLAVQALLDFAAQSGDVREVLAEVDQSNLASTRVLQRLGFANSGTCTDGNGEPVVRWLRRVRPAVQVEVVQGDALAPVREFYKSAGYGGDVSTDDLTLVATTDGRLAGVVRLCDENGVTVLRGMHIAPGLQRKGIGGILLAHCAPYLDRRTAYCLPYAHLVTFYGQCGFEVAAPEVLPPFLAARLTGYLSSGQRVLAMRRAGK